MVSLKIFKIIFVITSSHRTRGNPEPQAKTGRHIWIVSSLAFLAMTAVMILASIYPAHAQQTQPDDSCSAAESGRYRLSGGPDLGGDGYLLTCNGTQWIKVFGFESDGVFRPQMTNTASCTNGQSVTYDTATGGLTCGAVDIIAPVWVTPAGVIASTDVNLTIHTVVAASDENGTPAYQKISGAGWITVATDGTVSGRAPLSGGTYAVVVRATDGAGNTADRTFDVVVNEGDGPADCPNPGNVCGDGTVYAGKTPDGDGDFFVTQQDLPGTYPWNDGTQNWLNSAVQDCENFAVACRTGQANTQMLVLSDSATTTGGIDPHIAALACYCLGETHADAPDVDVPVPCAGDPAGTNDLDGYGYDDWYLPSYAEWDVMYSNLISPGDPDNPHWQSCTGYCGNMSSTRDGPLAGTFLGWGYWTSSEFNERHAYVIMMHNGGYDPWNGSKNEQRPIRCVRKN